MELIIFRPEATQRDSLSKTSLCNLALP